MRQRHHRELPLYQDDLRCALERLGAWSEVSDLFVQVRTEGALLHAPNSSHRLKEATPAVSIRLGDLTGRWCSCLVSAHTDNWGGAYTLGELTGVRVVLQLAVLDVALSHLVKKYTHNPQRSTRDLLMTWSARVGNRHPLSLDVLEQLSLSASEEEFVLAVGAVHEQTTMREVRAVLQDQTRNARPRGCALDVLVDATWLKHLARDETELLVGMALRSAGHYNMGNILHEVLIPSTVFSSGKVVFMRLPTYVYRYMERNSRDLGLGLQAVPWVADVDLAELSVLWTPKDTSGLFSLEQAVEVLTLT